MFMYPSDRTCLSLPLSFSFILTHVVACAGFVVCPSGRRRSGDGKETTSQPILPSLTPHDSSACSLQNPPNPSLPPLFARLPPARTGKDDGGRHSHEAKEGGRSRALLNLRRGYRSVSHLARCVCVFVECVYVVLCEWVYCGCGVGSTRTEKQDESVLVLSIFACGRTPPSHRSSPGSTIPSVWSQLCLCMM